MTRRNIAILISGRGSNLQAFIDACESGQLQAKICVVVSNNPEAEGLSKASDAGIPTAAVNHKEYPLREDFDQALVDTLVPYEVDLVVLAGFMRILTPVFIAPFEGRLLNIHPSLLPKYPGLNTHQRALDAGDTHAGVTVHFVTAELDGGPPIVQASEPIQADDSADALARRVLELEHRIYPLAAQWWLDDRLKLTDTGALLDGKPIPAQGLQYSELQTATTH